MSEHGLQIGDLVLVEGDGDYAGLAGSVTWIVGRAGMVDLIVVEIAIEGRVPIPADLLRRV